MDIYTRKTTIIGYIIFNRFIKLNNYIRITTHVETIYFLVLGT